MAEGETLSIFAQVVDAVAYLHKQDPPIAHRDLKLENFVFERKRSEDQEAPPQLKLLQPPGASATYGWTRAVLLRRRTGRGGRGSARAVGDHFRRHVPLLVVVWIATPILLCVAPFAGCFGRSEAVAPSSTRLCSCSLGCSSTLRTLQHCGSD